MVHVSVETQQLLSNENSAKAKVIPSDSVMFPVPYISHVPHDVVPIHPTHSLHAATFVMIAVGGVGIGHLIAAHNHRRVDVRLRGTVGVDGSVEGEKVEAFEGWGEDARRRVHGVGLVVECPPEVEQRVAGGVIRGPAGGADRQARAIYGSCDNIDGDD